MQDAASIQKLGEKIESALKIEIGKVHPEDAEFKMALLEKLPVLRELSLKHIRVLNKFKMANPTVEFPALHKELFSPDGMELV